MPIHTTQHTHVMYDNYLFFKNKRNSARSIGKRDWKLRLLLLCLNLCLYLPIQAQTLHGTVIDIETGLPLEAAMVSILHENSTIAYTLTDREGRYSLAWEYDTPRQIRVSLLGYRQEMHEQSTSGRQDFRLTTESILLKEVEIRPRRISIRKDTVRYDLSQFASEKDVHIKDVLKRLPGVNVEENGEVKYKGKPIDHFLVEGMDVTGGRYNQVNNNLNAKVVKTAEIMENYQSVKALKDKINSNEVALNLKLDPKARDQWFTNIGAGIGTSSAVATEGSVETSSGITDQIHWEGSLNAMLLGKGKQSLYNYKTNNNGTDLTTEQSQLIPDKNTKINLSPLLTQPAISAPLNKQRLLFNHTHTLNGNRIYKRNDVQSLRLQAGYTHDRITQKRKNRLDYYQAEDTLHLNESYHYRLRSDAAYAEMQYEDNSNRHYLNNRLKIEGEDSQSTSQELQQRIHTSQLKAKNAFQLLRNREHCTWQINSVAQYAFLPSTLSVVHEQEQYHRQTFHTDNSFSYLHKHHNLTLQGRAGIEGQWNRYTLHATHTANVSTLSVYLTPYLQWEKRRWKGNLSLPLRTIQYFNPRKNYLLYAPVLYLCYQAGYHWKFALTGSMRRYTGTETDLCPATYRTDYRTWYDNNQMIPVSHSRTLQLYGEYKNTVQEFFITASLNYGHTHRNSLYEQRVSQDSIIYTQRQLSNQTKNLNFASTLSKGFYDWHLTTSLIFSLNRNDGWQLTNQLLQSYRYAYMKAEPKINWLPIGNIEMEYHATIGYGNSNIGSDTHLSPLLDVVQRLHLTVNIGTASLRISGEHYRNNLGSHIHLNTLLADAAFICKFKQWGIEAGINNLFNKKEYTYTLYSATQSHTSRLCIRPRETMIKVWHQLSW